MRFNESRPEASHSDKQSREGGSSEPDAEQSVPSPDNPAAARPTEAPRAEENDLGYVELNLADLRGQRPDTEETPREKSGDKDTSASIGALTLREGAAAEQPEEAGEAPESTSFVVRDPGGADSSGQQAGNAETFEGLHRQQMALEDELDELHLAMDSLLGEGATLDVATLLDESDNPEETRAAYAEMFRQNLLAEDMDAAMALADCYHATKLAHDQLDETRVARGRAELAVMRQGVLEVVNWNKVMEDYFTEGTPQDMEDVSLVLSPAGEASENVHEAVFAARKLLHEASGHAGTEQPEENETDHERLNRQLEHFPDSNILDAFDSWLDLTQKAISYYIAASPYSGGGERIHRERIAVLREQVTKLGSFYERLSSAAGYLGFTSRAEEWQASPEVGDAIKYQAAQFMEAFDAADEQVVAEAAMQGPLQITNPELAREELDITQPTEWVSEKVRAFQPWVTAGLAEVRFTDEFEEEEIAGGTQLTCGEYSPDERLIKLGSSQLLQKKEEELRAQHGADAEAHIRTEARQSVEKIMDHEIAHHAHFHTVPIAQLREWQATIEKEQVRVDSYVQYMYDTAGVDEAAQEDFAASTALYTNDPAELLRVGGYERLRQLNKLFGHYDQRDIETAIGEVSSRTSMPIGAAWGVFRNHLNTTIRAPKQSRGEEGE